MGDKYYLFIFAGIYLESAWNLILNSVAKTPDKQIFKFLSKHNQNILGENRLSYVPSKNVEIANNLLLQTKYPVVK
jgi:hypothetical protein